MSQADELLVLGKKIEEYFPASIKDYFEKAGSGGNGAQVLSELHNIVWSEWLSSIDEKEAKHLDTSFGLPLCICFVLAKYTPASPETNRQHRNGFSEARRQKKKYRAGLVKEEYKKGGGDLLTRAYEAYANFQKYATSEMRSLSVYSKEEFMEKRMQETSAWFEDFNSNLIDYPFVQSLSFRAQADYLQSDISFHTFDIIWHKFGGDVMSAVGRFPRSLTDGVFSLQSGSDPLEYSVEEGSVFSYTRRVSGKKKVVTQVERVEGDFKAAARTEDGRKKLVNQLIEREVLSPSARRLDADDQQLYAVIYNMFGAGDTEPKEISIKQLAKAIGKTSRESDCRDVLNQVHKLSTYRVQHVEMDDTSLRFSDPEFFNATYEIKHAKKADDKEGVKVDAFSLVEGEKRKSIVEIIDHMNETIDDEDMKYKYSSVILSVEPSSATRRELMDSMNQIWLISTFEDNLTPRTKTVMRLLQARRIDLFRASNENAVMQETIPYNYFMEALQLGDMRKSLMEKTLQGHLNILTGEGRLLKSFNIDKKARSVFLEFNPFTQAELQLYRLDQGTEDA